jgi:hypothetical protein
MKKIYSMYLDTDAVRAARKHATDKDRSLSWIINKLLRETYLKGKPKPKKYLNPDKL